MMRLILLVNDKFLYIANPRTGTMSIHAALKGLADAHKYPHHTKAKDIIAGKHGVMQDDWHKLFKFAFIRHPLDYWVSWFHRDGGEARSFTEMILEKTEQEAQYHYFCDDIGDNLMDFLGHYESLEDDFQYICGLLGVKRDLPHLHKSKRSYHMDYYNADTRRHVRREFKKDFELGGYDFN